MKKIWKYAILLVALSALLCMSAFAADGLTVNSFVQVDGVDAVKAVDGKEYFTATYQGNAGSQYLILMLATETVPESQPEGTAMPDPTDGNILYINQAQADTEGVVRFATVYPMALEDSVIWLTGGPEAVALASIDVPDPVGVTVSGQVKSYNPGNATTVELKQGSKVKYTAAIDATTGSGQVTQNFSFTAVAAGTYDLVVTKAGHLTYTVTGVVVGTENVDLTAATGKAYQTITLLCGDIDANAWINSTDLGIVLQGQNYGKQTSVSGTNKVADLDGNGWINSTDLGIVLQGQHYGKGAVTVAY